MDETTQKRLKQLKQAHEAGLIDDDTYKTTVASLTGAAYQASADDGSVAQGPQAQAVGKQGVMAQGPVNAPIVTGTWRGDFYAADSGTDPDKLREAYLHYVLYTCGQLSLSGIDPRAASDTDAGLNLGAVYTALLTRSGEEMSGDERKPDLARMKQRQKSALAAFNEQAQLVLLGDPGSGKSTFVNFLALCLAGESLGRDDVNLALLTAPLPADDEDKQDEQKPQPWDHDPLLPVRVILRDLAARGLPEVGRKATAAHLWRFIAAELDACTLSAYSDHLQQELQEKGGVILLDGLDEVPAARERRVQIKEMVQDFAAAYPRCRLLVTSRTYAYQQQDWRLRDFDEALLAPFSQGQIRNFVDRWYAHIADIRGLHSDDAQGRATLLRRAIFNSSRLQELAERPLLLTLMASLHAWRGGSLPEKREQLYADTVDLLLDWWEKPKIVRDAAGDVTVTQPSLAEWLKVDRERVRDLLNRLAYEAHANQRASDARDTADIAQSELVDGLLQLSQNPDVKPMRLVEYLSQRAGLLVPRGVGVYTFPHRTIQEYLAACHLTDDDFPEKLAELARTDPNRWREVTLLAGAKAARGSSAYVWALAEALCYAEPTGTGVSEPDAWGAQLAGQTLAETADLQRVSPRNRPKLARVQTWLAALLRRGPLPPLERAQAGVSLAHLGDPRPGVMTLDGMQFCYVPPGAFWMGSEDGESREKPLHQVDLAYPYFMARFPVTNAQFGYFVEAGGYQDERYWTEAIRNEQWTSAGILDWRTREYRQRPYPYPTPFTLPNHPVVGVTWYEMVAFARWLTAFWQESGVLPPRWQIMLPSEAEWEKAARGGVHIPAALHLHTVADWQQPVVPDVDLVDNPQPQRNHPWGNAFDAQHVNGQESEIGATSTPGAFPGGASPYGCEEMVGNTWEWTRSQSKGYPYEAEDGREDFKQVRNSTWIRFRGGAYYSEQNVLRCAYRDDVTPSGHLVSRGFRVCVRPHFHR